MSSKPASFSEAVARLSKPVPARFIKQKPDKSRADYVPHHIIRQYLHIAFDDHRFETLQVLEKGSGQYAMRVRLTVMLGGEERFYEGWGESENRMAPLKSAESDAVKRIAAMHLGLGLHLWSREHYFLPSALEGQAEEAVQQAASRDADYGGDGDEPDAEDVQTAGAGASPTSEAPPSEPPSAPAPASITNKQRKRIFAQLGDLGIDEAGRKAILEGWYDGRSMTDLTAPEADEFYKRLTVADGQRAARRLAGVTDGPSASDGGGEAPEGAGGSGPEPDAYSWRAHAGELGLSSVEVLRAVREAWPANSGWNKPSRTKEIDAAVEKGGGAIVQAAIDTAAGKGAA